MWRGEYVPPAPAWPSLPKNQAIKKAKNPNRIKRCGARDQVVLCVCVEEVCVCACERWMHAPAVGMCETSLSNGGTSARTENEQM